MASRTSLLAATAACVVPAPMVTLPPATLMPLSSAMPPRSTTADGAMSPSFMVCSSVWPPAISLASSCALARTASATVPGLE